jgi:hypothetical protein
MEYLKNKVIKKCSIVILLIVFAILTRCSGLSPIKEYTASDICKIIPSIVPIVNDSIEFRVVVKIPEKIIDKFYNIYIILYAASDSLHDQLPLIQSKLFFTKSPDGYLYSSSTFKSFVPIKFANSELISYFKVTRREKSLETSPFLLGKIE